MNYKYNCDLCNYHTNRKGNFTKHSITKRHIKLSTLNKLTEKNNDFPEKIDIVSQKIDIVSQKSSTNSQKINKQLQKNKKKVCEYCNKIYSRNDHLKEHQTKCKNKLKFDIEKTKNNEIQKILDDKNKLEKKYKKSKKKLKKLETYYEEIKTENKEIKTENEELEKEYNDFLKKTANNLMKNKATSITNNNNTNNILNMHYVINNFTDAPNFSDQITEQLTDLQK